MATWRLKPSREPNGSPHHSNVENMAAGIYGVIIGAAVMATFGLCTIPALLAASLGLRRVVMGSRRARQGLAAVVLVSGLLTLSLRAGAFAEESSSEVPACHQ